MCKWRSNPNNAQRQKDRTRKVQAGEIDANIIQEGDECSGRTSTRDDSQVRSAFLTPPHSNEFVHNVTKVRHDTDCGGQYIITTELKIIHEDIHTHECFPSKPGMKMKGIMVSVKDAPGAASRKLDWFPET